VHQSVGLISRVVPDDVVGVETRSDDHEIALFPAEEDYIAGATPARRSEFTTVRWCARKALSDMGAPTGPLLPATAGAQFLGRHPTWPRGIVGSMTHCEGYRAAAVADGTAVAALGIDAELHGDLPAPALRRISGADELARLDALRREHPAISWSRIVFSAKESVFKALYPRTRRWFDLRDCGIVVDPAEGTFTVRLDRRNDAPPIIGRWAVDGPRSAGHLVTAAVIRRIRR
jgi:4'-phosphopantetheinyl transferase EntD